MTDTMTNADVVRRGYQAFNEADIETIDRLWADDVTWTTPGESTVAGTARGKEAVLAQYGRYGGETGGTFKAQLKAVFEGDDGRVVGLHRNVAHAKAGSSTPTAASCSRSWTATSAPAPSTSSTSTTGTSSGPERRSR